LLASTVPNCVAYDPAYAYELTVIIQDGLRRMFELKENKFYYITAMNENYAQPPMPEDVTEGIIKGMYRVREAASDSANKVQLMGAGTILREVLAAAEILEQDYGVAADVWSLTSINELQREGKAAQRWNLMHPEAEPKVPWVSACLADCEGPVVAATDYIKAHTDQIREFVPGRFTVLGTDGYGRSDTRARLREFFEVSREFVVLAALRGLAEEGRLPMKDVAAAMVRLGIDPDKVDPFSV
jgi:pyruvate dehydrogenase E1 component